MLLALLIASQVLYVASTATFGCTSIDETARLQKMRAAKKDFKTELMEQTFEGQCVAITKGKVVEGAIEATDSSILRVDRKIEPPGFLAPLHDFHELKRPSQGK
jgi:hypothetical protein